MKYLKLILFLFVISCGTTNTKEIEELRNKIDLLSKDLVEHNIESAHMREEVEEQELKL